MWSRLSLSSPVFLVFEPKVFGKSRDVDGYPGTLRHCDHGSTINWDMGHGHDHGSITNTQKIKVDQECCNWRSWQEVQISTAQIQPRRGGEKLNKQSQRVARHRGQPLKILRGGRWRDKVFLLRISSFSPIIVFAFSCSPLPFSAMTVSWMWTRVWMFVEIPYLEPVQWTPIGP